MSSPVAPPEPGCLYVVATPLGNLQDLSPRAAALLGAVDLIAAEDTRHSARLLTAIAAKTHMVALHEHNEEAVAGGLIERLQAGHSIALISDAGTPLVSDPGFVLVRAARAAGLPVLAVPGPCAAIAALSVSGMPPDRFVFEGFLPAKAAARRRRLGELVGETRSLLFYESSHRIVETVADIASVFGPERRLALARELTKLHEQSVCASAGEMPEWLAGDANRQRGEFVLVVAGAAAEPSDQYPVALPALLEVLLRGLPVAAAAKAAASLTGAPRNEAYRIALRLAENGGKE